MRLKFWLRELRKGFIYYGLFEKFKSLKLEDFISNNKFSH